MLEGMRFYSGKPMEAQKLCMQKGRTQFNIHSRVQDSKIWIVRYTMAHPTSEWPAWTLEAAGDRTEPGVRTN